MVMGPRVAETERQQFVMPASEAASGQLSVRVEVDPSDVVFIKGLVEASDGLASVFCDRGGSLVLASPLDRKVELALFLRDLEADVGARVIDRTVLEALPLAPRKVVSQ